MRRREFIAGLGAETCAVGARAQQGGAHTAHRRAHAGRRKRSPVSLPTVNDGFGPNTFVSAHIQALAGFGWADGRNVRMDVRLHGGDINRIRALAQELVGLQPDILLTGSTPASVARGVISHAYNAVSAARGCMVRD